MQALQSNYIKLLLCLAQKWKDFSRTIPNIQGLLKMELNLWTASPTLFTQNVITLYLVVVYMKKSRHPAHEVAPDTVANTPKFTVLATKIQ